MNILSILLVLLFFGLLLALWTRDFVRVLLASQREHDRLSGLSPSGTRPPEADAATDKHPETWSLARTSPAYLAFILVMGAVLAGSTLALTGNRPQALLFGVAFLVLGLWRKLRLAIMLRLSGKWAPQPPAGGFAGEKDRIEWERRQADMAPKALLKGALVIFASDLLLVGVVLAVALIMRTPS
ncbi:MAG: hypothetical protein HYY29_06020 [Chloroflexi bacterium]|nr:hypothetical protein [Chloroflexota bacterium]